MSTKQKGFSVVELLFVAVTTGLIVFVGYALYARQGRTHSSGSSNVLSRPIDNYTFKIDAYSNPDRSSTYRLYITADPPVIKQADGTYTELKSRISDFDAEVVTVRMTTHKTSFSKEECMSRISANALISCSEPRASSMIKLPTTLINAPDFVKAKLKITTESKTREYTLHKQGYVLSIEDGDKSLTKIPFYGADVRSANVYKPGGLSTDCQAERQDTKQLRATLQAAGAVLANDKYPGIDTVAQDQVLLISNTEDDYNQDLYTYQNGCKIGFAQPMRDAF